MRARVSWTCCGAGNAPTVLRYVNEGVFSPLHGVGYEPLARIVRVAHIAQFWLFLFTRGVEFCIPRVLDHEVLSVSSTFNEFRCGGVYFFLRGRKPEQKQKTRRLFFGSTERRERGSCGLPRGPKYSAGMH